MRRDMNVERRASLLPDPLRANTHAAGEVSFTVGACAVCGVRFGGLPERRTELEHVLRAHERICPGGTREGEIVTPFGRWE